MLVRWYMVIDIVPVCICTPQYVLVCLSVCVCVRFYVCAIECVCVGLCVIVGVLVPCYVWYREECAGVEMEM